MKIAIGSDHAGFPLKEQLKLFLQNQAHTVADVGCFSSDSVDYPDYAHQLAEMVAQKTVDFGVLICGSGQGMCIAANRHAGVRAALIRSEEDAQLAREHNDANVACFGARVCRGALPCALGEYEKLLQIFLSSQFAAGRHSKRVIKIDK